MDMPNGPIQIVPQGLLGLLNLKNNGKTPEFLQTNVQPFMDLLDMYVTGLLEQVSASVAVAAAVGPNSSDLVVPQTEVWFVHSEFVTTETLGAGEAIALSAAVAFNGIATIPVGSNRSGIAGERMRAVSERGIFIAGPGSIFGFWCEELTGAVNVDVQALIARARI